MKRKMAGISLLITALLVGVLINGYLTQQYTYEHEAISDIMSLTAFLANYAAENKDTFPDSWEELVEKGLVGAHPKYAAQFLQYHEGDPIHHPERLRWLARANLTGYALTDEGVVKKATSHPTRLVWLEGVDPSVYNESHYTRIMFEVWRAVRQERTGAPKGKKAAMSEFGARD